MASKTRSEPPTGFPQFTPFLKPQRWQVWQLRKSQKIYISEVEHPFTNSRVSSPEGETTGSFSWESNPILSSRRVDCAALAIRDFSWLWCDFSPVDHLETNGTIKTQVKPSGRESNLTTMQSSKWDKLQGPLDAEQFCSALIPLVPSPEEPRAIKTQRLD